MWIVGFNLYTSPNERACCVVLGTLTMGGVKCLSVT